MAGLQTEYNFTLPKGYVDSAGVLHRTGTMRLATARDEIEPLRDQRVTSADDPYLTILVLARVVTDLGTVPQVGVREIENLFAADLAFLQDLYGIINFGSPADVEALQRAASGSAGPAVLDEEESEPLTVGGDDAGTDDAQIDDAAADASLPDEDDRMAKASSARRRERIEEVGRPSGS
jgi:hypothetical protein